MKIKKLYIVGNGFDMHHGLFTSYARFALFLQKNYSDLYEYFINYYYLTDLDPDDEDSLKDKLWAEFEKALADLDYQTVLDDHSDLAANPGAEDFRDRDWHSYQIEMEGIVDDLTKHLFKAFKQFILAVNFPKNVDHKKVKLDPDALFISFNYTDTLEHYYSIPENQILYIHNKAKDPNSVLVLGHGISPDHFKETDPQPPEGLTDEEYQEWRDRMADEYDYSFESAKQQILSYFDDSFKNTGKVIADHKEFFDKLNDVEEIITLGHSLSDVDLPYLAHIASLNNHKANWKASYHSDTEVEERKAALMKIGIPEKKINVFQITDLL
jgi:hypothetical protein